jgi:hypothetical protein
MAGSIATFDVVVTALTLLAISLITLSVYRLYLHPLANVPGPNFAALTSWHELWYDCFQGGGGQHAFKMREMHDRYGRYTPSIRICGTGLISE